MKINKYLNKKAQATVEFILTISVFMMCILGVLDVAKIAIAYIDMGDNLHYYITKGIKDYPSRHSKYINQAKANFYKTCFMPGAEKNYEVSYDLKGRTLSSVVCYTGELDLSLSYAQMFSQTGDLHLKKKICSLQEEEEH